MRCAGRGQHHELPIERKWEAGFKAATVVTRQSTASAYPNQVHHQLRRCRVVVGPATYSLRSSIKSAMCQNARAESVESLLLEMELNSAQLAAYSLRRKRKQVPSGQ